MSDQRGDPGGHQGQEDLQVCPQINPDIVAL